MPVLSNLIYTKHAQWHELENAHLTVIRSCNGQSWCKTPKPWWCKTPNLWWCEVSVSKLVFYAHSASAVVSGWVKLQVCGCIGQSMAPPMQWGWASCEKVMHWFQLIIRASFLDRAVVWSHRCSCVFCVVAEEEASRFLTFCTNMKRIKTIQESEQGSATYGVNKFADISGTPTPTPYIPSCCSLFPCYNFSELLLLSFASFSGFKQSLFTVMKIRTIKIIVWALNKLGL